jgi:predicted nucleic-acid-binding protein
VIGIDTNVLVRYFIEDDPVQSRLTDSFFHSLSSADPGWVSQATILEFAWIMKSVRRLNRRTIAEAMGKLTMLDSIIVERADIVDKALQRYRNGKAEFADCLIAASGHAAGCSKTVTFDRLAARDAGMQLLA